MADSRVSAIRRCSQLIVDTRLSAIKIEAPKILAYDQPVCRPCVVGPNELWRGRGDLYSLSMQDPVTLLQLVARDHLSDEDMYWSRRMFKNDMNAGVEVA